MTNIIYFTRLMQSSDKVVINSMIDVDQNLANYAKANNETENEALDHIYQNFKFTWEIMDGKSIITH